MQTYRIWEGERTFLPGDDTSKFTVIEITGEEIGMFEDADYDSGRTYYVYEVEGGIIIHLVNWKSGIGEPHHGYVYRFSSLEEAAQNGELSQALKEMRLL